MFRRKYPASAQKLIDRAHACNKAIEKVKQDPRILIIAPDDTLCKDAETMKKFYRKAYEDDKAVFSFIK